MIGILSASQEGLQDEIVNVHMFSHDFKRFCLDLMAVLVHVLHQASCSSVRYPGRSIRKREDMKITPIDS